MTPYWAPGEVVKVCALDAQDALVGETGAKCNKTAGFSDTSCGCGPELRWCMPDSISSKILNSLEQDLDHRVDGWWMGLPYDALLTDAPAFVNGPISHYLRHQVQFGGNLKLNPIPIPQTQIPIIAYTDDDTWVGVELSSSHAGALSSPAFLLRFQTNRSRASKFSTEFLCDPFVAPSGGLPPATDEEAMEPDLQKRAGCKYCHARLEPTASYWGRFPESGAGLLSKSISLHSPKNARPVFKDGPCPSMCNQYVTKASVESEKAYFGWLKHTLFLKADAMPYIDRDLPRWSNAASSTTSCHPASRKRLHLAVWPRPHPTESAWLDDIAQDFVVSGFTCVTSFEHLQPARCTAQYGKED